MENYAHLLTFIAVAKTLAAIMQICAISHLSGKCFQIQIEKKWKYKISIRFHSTSAGRFNIQIVLPEVPNFTINTDTSIYGRISIVEIVKINLNSVEKWF